MSEQGINNTALTADQLLYVHLLAYRDNAIVLRKYRLAEEFERKICNTNYFRSLSNNIPGNGI